MAFFTGAVAVNPTLPTSTPLGVRPTPVGSVISVHSGNDLQSIYNAAACGSDLVLDEGAVFTGTYVFNKACTSSTWILIEATGCSAGTVAIPTYASTTTANLLTTSVSSTPPIAPPTLTHYATLRAAVGLPPISTTSGSNVPGSYNYFGCLEVTSSVGQFVMVQTTNAGAETVTSQFGDHFLFDRLYVHTIYPVQATRGFNLAGSNISVVNSYVSGFDFSEAQAILGSAGPGPYNIHNNFLSASTEIILFGGTGPSPGLSCTVAASPAPTTTHATVTGCKDANAASVASPTSGTIVTFYTSTSAPFYWPSDAVTVTANTAGALTFTPTHAAPLAGVGKIAWGMRPNDNTVTNNFFWKNPCWNSANPCFDGTARSSKDFIESKMGQRWVVNANIFMNSWNAGQQYAFNFNSADQTGGCPWCFSSDVTFTNNIVKNIAGDFVLISTQGGGSGSPSNGCPAMLNRVLIKNNLFWPTGTAQYNPASTALFSITPVNNNCGPIGQLAGDSYQIVHNTFLGGGSNGQIGDGSPYNFTNFVIKDNVTQAEQYLWFLISGACTEPCFNSNLTTSGTWTATNNAIINSSTTISNATILSRYGAIILPTMYNGSQSNNYGTTPFASYTTVATDYHGFALTGTGGWRGAASDGTDPGVNFSLLDAALNNTVVNTATCDLNVDGLINGKDVQLQIRQTTGIGLDACTNKIDGTSTCTPTDVYRVIAAALGGACVLN